MRIAILNPRAGLAATRARDALLRHPDFKDVELRVTAAPGDAQRWAAEAGAAGADLVLAMGGDGTINEAASGLVGTRVPLGVVPVGSGNGLARTLGIPLQPGRALDALRDAVVRRIDVGMANDRPFLNIAGAGLDALVGADFHEHGRRGGRRGIFTYVRLSLRRTMSYQAESWSLSAGGQTFEARALVVAFVNGRQWGAGAVVAPGARLDDGLLDVVLIEDAPFFETAWNATRLFLGGIEKLRAYRHVAAEEAVLTATGGKQFAFHRDGEPEPPCDRVEVRLRRLALPVLVPRATAADPRGPFVTRD
ncbi:MAG TPA: YegS/Rv2252/BmrU family lipid kinase [Vicinamibacteria bacterium]|nr:YegS/Rv2252/BmrU family lipid kinase [Vicinamibacteria bacterium]